jgi:hypothetical protein
LFDAAPPGEAPHLVAAREASVRMLAAGNGAAKRALRREMVGHLRELTSAWGRARGQREGRR